MLATLLVVEAEFLGNLSIHICSLHLAFPPPPLGSTPKRRSGGGRDAAGIQLGPQSVQLGILHERLPSADRYLLASFYSRTVCNLFLAVWPFSGDANFAPGWHAPLDKVGIICKPALVATVMTPLPLHNLHVAAESVDDAIAKPTAGSACCLHSLCAILLPSHVAQAIRATYRSDSS